MQYKQLHEPGAATEKVKIVPKMNDAASKKRVGIKKEAVLAAPPRNELKKEAPTGLKSEKRALQSKEHIRKGDAYQAKLQKGPPPKEEIKEQVNM